MSSLRAWKVINAFLGWLVVFRVKRTVMGRVWSGMTRQAPSKNSARSSGEMFCVDE